LLVNLIPKAYGFLPSSKDLSLRNACASDGLNLCSMCSPCLLLGLDNNTTGLGLQIGPKFNGLRLDLRAMLGHGSFESSSLLSGLDLELLSNMLFPINGSLAGLSQDGLCFHVHIRRL